ncbi:hypothetical protein [Streptomyces sp. NPDC005953]|uniref:hypothetical protein n=1 Tax=Streptomyces sp. NPDC005953 TaxID=3156719 RepID=UPI0033E5FC15
MDALPLGAVATIVVGLITAAAAFYGHRGQRRTDHTGVVMTGLGGLVDQLQEERAELQQRLAANETALAAAYAELAGERANKAELQAQIAQLNTENARLITENARLRDRIVELGGTTS